MQPLGLLLLTVALGTPRSEPILPPDLNLNEYGEGGYLWSGYTPQNPGQPLSAAIAKTATATPRIRSQDAALRGAV